MKAPTKFLPRGPLFDLFPKALWADIAWNLAMRLCADNSERAFDEILKEAERIRPENWSQKLAACTRWTETLRAERDARKEGEVKAGSKLLDAAKKLTTDYTTGIWMNFREHDVSALRAAIAEEEAREKPDAEELSAEKIESLANEAAYKRLPAEPREDSRGYMTRCSWRNFYDEGWQDGYRAKAKEGEVRP